MADETAFDAPDLAIDRVYTRTGDSGETSLVGGQRVAKDNLRIECFGTVDELNAFVGAARRSLLDESGRVEEVRWLAEVLRRVQHELFNLGSLLATLPADVHPRMPRVTPECVARLEREMDRCNDELQPLRSFVLPGGARPAVDLHVARTVCRRAERHCVALARVEEVDAVTLKYLNRLSDALFVWSRWAARALGAEEVLWDPNLGRTEGPGGAGPA